MVENINWYPGHMKKTRELIAANLKMVDVVVEVIDARIPVSSRNPIIDELTGGKQRIIILNKSDLADEGVNEAWAEKFRSQGLLCVTMNCNTGAGSDKLMKTLGRLQEQKNEGRVRKTPLRMMVVGVPNVGKSSLINRLTGRKSAKTGDKPGVTRGKQWLTIDNDMQLLDTPGILWPKFEDPEVGLNLAFCGSIKDEILELQDLALELIGVLAKDYLPLLAERYKLAAEDLEDLGEGFDEDGMPVSANLELMQLIAKKRGFLLAGKRVDYERTARTVLDEFRAGLVGRISLEKPND